jgi:integrase
VRQAIAQWLDTARHEDTTRARYDDLIRIYITPMLGKVVAGKLDAEILEQFCTRLQRCRALCDARPRAGHVCRPLSASTVRKIHYIVSAALERAVRWRHLGVNPASLAVAPTPARPEPDPPTAEEAAAIVGAAWRDPQWALLLWLVMVTGMRRGEISALRWRHVDLRTSTVRVFLRLRIGDWESEVGFDDPVTEGLLRPGVRAEPPVLDPALRVRQLEPGEAGVPPDVTFRSSTRRHRHSILKSLG